MKKLAIAYVFFIIFLIVAAGTGSKNFILDLHTKIPYGDKVGHVLLMGNLALCLNLLFGFRKKSLLKMSFYFGSIFCFFFITLEECSQMFLANRTFSLVDLGCNYLGIALFGETLPKLLKPSGKTLSEGPKPSP